jgi:putative methionine-R-sulfoxide reductase with GAF domain
LVENLEAFLNQPSWIEIKNEPDIKKILADDFKSFIFYPIFRNQRLVASVSLLNKSNRKFKEHHKQLLRNLPIDSAVHMALFYHNRRESSFTSDLINSLANTGNDVNSLAAIIVSSVAAHYKWDSVSLYKVNPIKGEIKLLKQDASGEEYLIDKNYTQKISEGVLGHVSQHENVVNIGNVDEDEKLKDVYIHAVKPLQMKSELCIPIRFSGTFWLLNIEDKQIDAFHKEEQNEICRVMNNVCEYLESNWLNRFLEASMEAGTDPILVSDIEGRILQVNPVAINMLPITMAQNRRLSTQAEEIESRGPLRRIQPIPMKSLFVDPTDAGMKITASYQTPTDIKLKLRGGGTMPALLTGVNLQEEFGYTIHIAADMSAQYWRKQIENLGKIYHEIAIQTKTPISLIGGWIKRIRKYATVNVLKESVDKILRQLKKLEVTYDRIALYSVDSDTISANDTLLDIFEVIEAIQNDLPVSELELIKWEYEKGQCFLNGDMYQLKFSFETILLHLLRHAPQDDFISVNINADDDKISVKISGWHPQNLKTSPHTPDQKNDVAKAIADMAIGEKLVGRFIRRHGGTYQRPDQTDDRITFRFELPRLKGI